MKARLEVTKHEARIRTFAEQRCKEVRYDNKCPMVLVVIVSRRRYGRRLILLTMAVLLIRMSRWPVSV